MFFFLKIRPPPRSTLIPYASLFRSKARGKKKKKREKKEKIKTKEHITK